MVDQMPARVRNKWGEGERLRGEILDAASRLLSRLGGADGLTMRGIAREAGIAPASIYQHFDDRAAVVRGLLDHEFDRLQAVMRDADKRVDAGDVLGRVRAQVHAYCAFAIDNPGHYRLMLTSRAERTQQFLDVIDTVAGALRRCEDAGHVLRLPADKAAAMIMVGAHGRVALRHSSPTEINGSAQIAAFADELVSLVFE